MCLASAADALVPRMARSYTAEQRIRSHVSRRMAGATDGQIRAAQADAVTRYNAGESMDYAIQFACDSLSPTSIIRETLLAGAVAAGARAQA